MKSIISSIGSGLISLIITFAHVLYAEPAHLSSAAVYNFIDSQVMPIKTRSDELTDNYFAQNTTYLEVNEEHDFRILRGYLYSSALAAIVFTHKGLLENNPQHLEKAAGIFRTFNHHQYSADGPYPHLAGAFPNQLISEDYHDNPGPTQPYKVAEQYRIVRHGNNAWYLVALGYYTLRTGDRQFVPVIEKLADYFSSERAQQQEVGSDNHGAILFGWGNYAPREPLTTKKLYVATEHQAESFAGLIYAAEVMRTERHSAYKSQQYLNAAHNVLKFVTHKLYNPNNRHPNSNIVGSFFHTGTDQHGIPVAYSPSLDAQTCAFLAFAKPLLGIEDISNALDYAWQNMYGTNPQADNAQGVCSVFAQTHALEPIHGQGALWYQGDNGIWLAGSAQLALSFKFAHHLQDQAEDLQRSTTIFRDMSKLVWPEDTATKSIRTISWPQGGFSCFSDHYYANTEPGSVGVSEKVPSLEPTAWRYFDINNINPFSVKLSEPLPAPGYATLATGTKGNTLSWEPHPLAVGYVIMRSDSKIPIAYVSNLESQPNMLHYQDTNASNPNYNYIIIPRDLSGQQGESRLVGPISQYALHDNHSKTNEVEHTAPIMR